MRSLGALALACGLAATTARVSSASAGTCEEDVVAECVATACPAFCKAGDAAGAQACQAACTATDRCALSLFGGTDRADQLELEAQKRAQLMSCLAENRGKIEVPPELGAPILTADGTAAPAAPQTTPPKRGSVRDAPASKRGWRKLQIGSFAERRKHKRPAKRPQGADVRPSAGTTPTPGGATPPTAPPGTPPAPPVPPKTRPPKGPAAPTAPTAPPTAPTAPPTAPR